MNTARNICIHIHMSKDLRIKGNGNMNQEVLFGKTLEQVKRTAKEQGNCISKEQVEEAFAALSLSEEQMEMVYGYLRQHKIGIGEPADPDAYLAEEERLSGGLSGGIAGFAGSVGGRAGGDYLIRHGGGL